MHVIPSAAPHWNTQWKTAPSLHPGKPYLHPTLPHLVPVIETNLLLPQGFPRGRDMSPGNMWFIPWDKPKGWKEMIFKIPSRLYHSTSL